MVDKFEKAKRSQKLKDLGIRQVGASLSPNRPEGQLKGADYLIAHACFSCRVSFKRAPSGNVPPLCPICARPSAEMGRSFKAPRKHDAKQWKKVQLLWEAGYRFPTNGFKSAGYPKRLADVEAFIRANPRHPFRLREYWPST